METLGFADQAGELQAFDLVLGRVEAPSVCFQCERGGPADVLAEQSGRKDLKPE